MSHQSDVLWVPTPATSVQLKEVHAMHGGPVGMCLPEHAHTEVQIETHFSAALPEGEAIRASPLLPGKIAVIAPQQPHRGQWNEGTEVVVMLLGPQMLAEAANELFVHDRFEIIGDIGRADSLIHELSGAVRREFRSAHGISRLYIESVGQVFAGHLLRQYAATAAPYRLKGKLSETDLRKVAAFIDEHLEDGLCMSDLAQMLNMGPQRFTRLFRAVTGQTPYQYVLRRRIERAKRLLTARRLSLAEIAYQLGFASQSHFTAVFHRTIGSTPKTFRDSI